MIAGVVNFTQVDGTVACAGATPSEAFRTIAALGFTSVVNLRMAHEPGVAEEAAAVAEAGLRYFHLPMNPAAPESDTADQFLAVVGDRANHPLYIHCASANRVGGAWAIKRVVQDGWTRDAAMAEGRTIGMKSPAISEFVECYLDARGNAPDA